MTPENVRSAADAKKIVEERKLDHVKVGVFDNDGIMRGKYMGRDKFFSALDKGFGFCDVVLGWDSNDQLYDNVKYTGWHTAYPDAPVRVLPDTCRPVPFEGDMVMFLGEFAEKAEAVCPRATLRRVLKKADDMGYKVNAATEFEFFMFKETPESSPREGLPRSHDHDAGLLRLLGAALERALGVLSPAHEHVHGAAHPARRPAHRDRPGRARGRDPVLRSARSRGPRRAVQDLHEDPRAAQRHDGHVHGQVVEGLAGAERPHPHLAHAQHRTARPRSTTLRKPHNMSDEMRWYVGGQQKLMPELLAMVACTVNSYSRLIPGFWAPTTATWGVENRTCALRVIPGGASSQRVEYRIAAADINPYLALAVAIGSGLYGIENKIEPDPMVEGNAYEKKFPKNRSLPRTLTEASEWLEKSKAGRALFGDAFVEHFAASREWEDREFRRAITDWELARYFEII